MHLLRCSFVLLFASKQVSITEAFVSPHMNIRDNHQQHLDTQLSKLHATTETDADRLLRKARELREQAASGEDELHNTLIQRKRTRDAATDSIIQQLFPDNDNSPGVCALCARLREKRLASDMLVRVVERLHEREVAAKGLEHVEPSVHHDQVTFKRVAQPDDEELARIQGLVNKLIEAAEVLDKEFIEQKSECQGKIVSITFYILYCECDISCCTRGSSIISHIATLLLLTSLFIRHILISCIGEEVRLQTS